MPHATNAEKSHVCVWTVTGLWFTWQISLALLLLTIVIYIHLVVKCWRLDSQGWIKKKTKKLWTVKQSQCHFYSQDLAPSCNNYLCFGGCGGLSLVTLVIFPPLVECVSFSGMIWHYLCWCHQARGAPCTLLCCRKARTSFSHRCPSAVFPAYPQTASCLLRGRRSSKMGGRKQHNVKIA